MPRNAHHPNNFLIARVGDFLEVALLEVALLEIALLEVALLEVALLAGELRG